MHPERINILENDARAADVGENGISTFVATLFVICSTAGSGFLALPKAVENTGVAGFPLLVVLAALSLYTSILLTDCWLLAYDHHPGAREYLRRSPYTAIAELTYGGRIGFLVSMLMNFTLFGAAVVYLLLSADNIANLIPGQDHVYVCRAVPVIGAFVIPFLVGFLSPKDWWFWPLAFVSTVATGLSVILLIADIGSHTDGTNDVTHTSVSRVDFFMAIGTLCFAWETHAVSPVIHTEMRHPKNFKMAIYSGYIALVFIYLPCTYVSYYLYGDKIQPNVNNSIPTGSIITSVVKIFMTAHLLIGIVIALYPVCRDIECRFQLPEGYSVKSAIVRASLTILAVFMAMWVPHFDSLMALLGGISSSFLVFICPPIFYLKLRRNARDAGRTPVPMLIVNYVLVLLGVGIMTVASIGSITNLSRKFGQPCYFNMSQVRA